MAKRQIALVTLANDCRQALAIWGARLAILGPIRRDTLSLTDIAQAIAAHAVYQVDTEACTTVLADMCSGWIGEPPLTDTLEIHTWYAHRTGRLARVTRIAVGLAPMRVGDPSIHSERLTHSVGGDGLEAFQIQSLTPICYLPTTHIVGLSRGEVITIDMEPTT